MATAESTNGAAVNIGTRNSDVNHLSDLQRQILVGVWNDTRLRERQCVFNVRTRRRGAWAGECGGVGCRPSIGWQWRVVSDKSPTRSQSAAVSRAMRRLVDRGLLDRGNLWTGSSRNISVRLTDAGRVIASTLAGETDPFPTSASYENMFPPTPPGQAEALTTMLRKAIAMLPTRNH
jgi:hypothetical protein